ncbi:non-SMC mitotic condensation complex subunit 1, putative [Angomonas deanei]|uniref:Non-SMC mitotic condensation complex subunit 1, putative n=1 Tax=Angomonas deanei TaxID=59799 RepID=A0A7G2CSK7_9TRYP|nr:non-SMC mitotic condensation complex subunit 1, putative [Angomonas deanei]
MALANSAINALHHLCEVPVLLFTYVLQCLSLRVDRQHQEDAFAKAQLFYVLGLTALKQLVSIETAERLQLKAMEETNSKPAAGENESDSMNKELGFGSHECKRHAIQELAQKRKAAILSNSIWSEHAPGVVSACKQKPPRNEETPFERICAVMCLCNLMIVSEEFCSRNLNLLFTIVANKHEMWVVKTNIVVALGDLACVHPNLLGPYLKEPTTGFFKLLVDDDIRVRAVTIQVCSHLVLGEMLRIRDHLYTIVKLVADPDPTIAKNAETFVQNLAIKEKEKTGNLIPPLVTQLSNVMPADKFQLALRTLLEKVEGDKPIESLVERLCQRFEAYSEKSKKRLALARNIAFCLSELSYGSERLVKRITSETCYQQYRLWLRDPEIFDLFKVIAAKAKRSGRVGVERRDKTVIEEWESRMLAEVGGDEKQVEEEEDVEEDSG